MTQSTIPFFIIVIIFCFFFGIIFFVLTKQAEMEWDDDRFEDDTIDSFKHNIRSSLYRTMLAGLGGDFSSAGFKYQEAGFKQAANVEVMQTFFLILIFVVQIIALNGLIAILSNTFEKVNYEKTARVNKELAQMMVEYMDTWSFFPESWSNRFEPCSKRVGGVLSKIWNCIFRCTAKDMGAKCQCCEKNKSCCCCHSMGKWLYKAFKYMENHDHIFDDLETMELKTCWVHKLELCSQKMSRKFTEDLKASSRRANNKRHDETQRKVSHIEDLMKVMQLDIEKLTKNISTLRLDVAAELNQ
jgi:polyhydroxyalkanoate synthesis regulator phasin